MKIESTRMDGGCPDEGILVAFIDGALDEGERARIENHVSDCETCRGRVESLEERAGRISKWIQRHDPPAPPLESYEFYGSTSARPLRLRWAAAAGFVLAMGALSGPAIGWVADQIQRNTGSSEVAPTGPEDGPPAAQSTSFMVHGSELTLVFQATVPEMVLLLGPSSDSLATLRLPHSGIGLTVAVNEIEIDNRPAHGGIYRLEVPAGIRTVYIDWPGEGLKRIDSSGTPIRVGPRSDRPDD